MEQLSARSQGIQGVDGAVGRLSSGTARCSGTNGNGATVPKVAGNQGVDGAAGAQGPRCCGNRWCCWSNRCAGHRALQW